MAVIAVAGGSGKLGRTLVEGIQAVGQHEVKILARQASSEAEKGTGASIVVVNYDDVKGLARTFEEHQIHTVICAFNVHAVESPETNPELAVLQAASVSQATKRFMANGWLARFDDEMADQIIVSKIKRHVVDKMAEAVNVETTVIHNGMFLDYWAMPGVKTHLTPINMILDIDNDAAALPGDGEQPAPFTHTTDIAKFVAASLELEKWDPEYALIGDVVTWNQFVRIAEEAKGIKFNVTYDGVDKLKQGLITELPFHVPVYQFMPKVALQGALSVFELWFAQSKWAAPAGVRKLNDLFPDIKLLSVREAVFDGLKGQQKRK